jgi:ribosomal protein uS5
MEVKSVQKQTQAGQRTRFKAYAIVGDEKNYIGLGWKCHKEVQGAIKGAVTMAKLNLIPVRKGYWGNKIGSIHTVPCKVTGKSGSVKVRLVPAPRGTGLVAPPVTKKLFNFAGIRDIYTKTEGSTRTRGNFVKAAFAAIKAAYEYNSPDWWGRSVIDNHPFVTFEDWLATEKVKN